MLSPVVSFHSTPAYADNHMTQKWFTYHCFFLHSFWFMSAAIDTAGASLFSLFLAAIAPGDGETAQSLSHSICPAAAAAVAETPHHRACW